MTELLRPTLDVVFKLLFADKRNENLLRSLVSTLLDPAIPIVELEVLNPETTKETVASKGAVLDVRVRLANRCQVNIEMQASPQRSLDRRTLFYWARLYTASLERGHDYAELLPTISLFILNFVELPTLGYHSEFRLLDVVEHHPFSEDLVLHVLELPKVPADGSTEEPLLLKWGRFLKAKTPSDLEALAMTDPVFEEAKDALERLSEDPKARELARERELWEWNLNTWMRGAEREGFVQGERSVLRRQLTQKFGDLPADALARLERATRLELERWAERVLTAATLDEVFAP